MSIYNKNNRYAKIKSYYGRLFKLFNMPCHAHNSCEIMYVIEGTATVTVGEKAITLGKNQFIFLDQNIPHKLEVNTNATSPILMLEFTVAPAEKGIDLYTIECNIKAFANFLKDRHDYLVLHDNENLGFAIKDLVKELEKNEPHMLFLRDILFTRVLIELARCSESNHFKGIAYINKAKEFIAENFCDQITVPLIAAAAGINSAYLQTLFNQYDSCSIMKFVNNQRINKAKFLLGNSNMDIIDIAFEIGFNSRQHFAYIFKKNTQLSPQQYRKLAGHQLTANSLKNI